MLQGVRSAYRALVTDIVLRGRIDGWEVASRARQNDPEFPVVYMSGAAAAEWPFKGVPNSIVLSKPFAPAQLVTAVSSLVNDSRPATGGRQEPFGTRRLSSISAGSIWSAVMLRRARR